MVVNTPQPSFDGSDAMSVTTTSAPDWRSICTRPMPSPPSPPVTNDGQNSYIVGFGTLPTDNRSVLEPEQLRQIDMGLRSTASVQLAQCIIRSGSAFDGASTIALRSVHGRVEIHSRVLGNCVAMGSVHFHLCVSAAPDGMYQFKRSLVRAQRKDA